LLKLTAIVPATDNPRTLARCRRAIARSHEPPEEIIVVDDPTIHGPARARNLAAESATGDVLVFVDSDVEVHPDAFALIRRAFEADEQLAAVFGSYDDDPEPHGLISDFRNLLHHHVHHQGAGPATTFWAGLGAIRRDVFLAAGGFDADRYPHASIEDIELGVRLTADGARIELEPRIQGKHLKRWTLAQMIRTDLRRRGIPWAQLLLERPGTPTALNLGWLHRASAAASVVFFGSLVARKPRVALVALGANCVLNASFYGFLATRRGWRQAVVGIPVHMVHHVVGSAAVPAALALYLRRSSH
jgi:Glycosyl transferase family 2